MLHTSKLHIVSNLKPAEKPNNDLSSDDINRRFLIKKKKKTIKSV